MIGRLDIPAGEVVVGDVLHLSRPPRRPGKRRSVLRLTVRALYRLPGVVRITTALDEYTFTNDETVRVERVVDSTDEAREEPKPWSGDELELDSYEET